METRFDFALTQPQVIEVFKKQARKVTKMLLVVGIIVLILALVLALVHFLVENAETLLFAILFLFVDIMVWTSVLTVRRSAAKNAERYFKWNSVNDIVEYSYLLTEIDFVVSQPALGNVMHVKYDMITQVNNLDGYVTVMLETNQFLPILDNEHTAQLIYTLKSFAKVVK